MPKAYFYKEIASNTFYVMGAPVQYDFEYQNRGFIALDSVKDNALIAAITDAANDSVGGIVRSTEAEYEAKKVEAQSTPSQKPLREKELLRQVPKGPFDKRAAAPAVDDAAPAPKAAEKLEIPPAVPFTNSTLGRIAAQQSPPAATPPLEGPAGTSESSEKPVEGFRPAPRRISRKPSATPEPQSATQ